MEKRKGVDKRDLGKVRGQLKTSERKTSRSPAGPTLRAEVKRLRAALADFRDHGVRFDLNPTESISFSHADKAGFDSYVKGRNDGATFYQGYLRSIDQAVRGRAAIALAEKTVAQVAWESLSVGGAK